MADISKIKLPNGTTYDIKDIVARERGLPAGGNAGQVLSKIDGTDYNTEWIDPPSGGGGGSGSGYTETSLWSGTQTTTGTIALSDSIQNYDIIVLRWTPHQSTNYYQQTSMILVSSIVLSSASQYFISTVTFWKTTSADYYSTASFHFTDYTHLTLDEVTSGSIFDFTLLEVVGLKFSSMETAFIYSNEERVVGVWTDNKPLYQKTIDFGALPLTTTKTVAHNIANVDKIWIYDGFVYNSTDGIFSQLNRTTNSFAYQWETKVDRTNVIMQDYAPFGNDSSAIITVQYTKTTDTPGSGPYVTSGSYAHHYSTDEQVVGTWIDGSTLYEKTQYGGITFSTQGTWYDTNITNIDKIVSVEGSIYRGTASEDGEPINIGYWNASIISNWILRDHTLKVKMERIASGEVYRLNSITVRYTKTS